jgi:hypothetical protein
MEVKMNKFINPPDSPQALVGCLFWLAFFALGAAVFWVVLLRLAGALL